MPGEAMPRRAQRRIDAALAALKRPRKHYQWYYATRPANADMMRCPQGLHAFLRAYYHHKSADWPGNEPHRSRAGCR
jgi:phytoene dehydrogenase-like protein